MIKTLSFFFTFTDAFHTNYTFLRDSVIFFPIRISFIAFKFLSWIDHWFIHKDNTWADFSLFTTLIWPSVGHNRRSKHSHLSEWMYWPLAMILDTVHWYTDAHTLCQRMYRIQSLFRTNPYHTLYFVNFARQSSKGCLSRCLSVSRSPYPQLVSVVVVKFSTSTMCSSDGDVNGTLSCLTVVSMVQ